MYPLNVGLIIGSKRLWDGVQECLNELPVRVVIEQSGSIDWPQLTAKLDEARPDLLLVDVGLISGSLKDAFATIRTLPHAPAIAAIHAEADPELILEAVRAGASEFLYPPFPATLTKALTRISAEREANKGTRTGGKVLGFLSAKGGCGATTLACHLALELPRQTNDHALLADFDLHAGMIAFLLKTKSEYSVLDAAKNLHRMDLSFWKKLICNGNPGLEVITAPESLSGREALGPESVASVLAFARRHYGWTIADLGRGISESTLRILEAVDEIFLVTTIEVPALHQAKAITQRLLDSGVRRDSLRLVINRMPRNPDLTLQEMETLLGIEIYATVPNDYPSLHDCYSEGRLLGADTPIRRHLSNVACRIAGVAEQKPKKRFSLFG